MCGRYALYGPIKRTPEHDRWFDELEAFGPRYNIAPTQACPVARLVAEKPVLAPLRWGLIPFWARDIAIGNRLINARAETVSDKPAFRAAYRARRCLVPASGFYEWRKVPRGKQPYYITGAGGALLAFAGLWEQWQPAGAEPTQSFTIITTDANASMKGIHDRMPVILAPEHYEAWLTASDPRELMRPCQPDMLTAYPVSTAVNSPRNDAPALVEPLPV
ncbi:MAG: SOS response-associated peptidase [Betaproteobacteria bacterium]|nr:SOS response-associated peptidase [Betaproteobacteria bacterium]